MIKKSTNGNKSRSKREYCMSGYGHGSGNSGNGCQDQNRNMVDVLLVGVSVEWRMKRIRLINLRFEYKEELKFIYVF